MIEISYQVFSNIREFICYVLLKDSLDNILWSSQDTYGHDLVTKIREPGLYTSTCTFPGGLLSPGHYFVTIGIDGKGSEILHEEHVDAISFKISEVDFSVQFRPKTWVAHP